MGEFDRDGAPVLINQTLFSDKTQKTQSLGNLFLSLGRLIVHVSNLASDHGATWASGFRYGGKLQF